MIAKKILAGFLAVLMLGSVAGCAGESDTYTTEKSSVEQSQETLQEEGQENVQGTLSEETEVHATEEMSREQREEFFNKKAEYGDTVYLGCYRKPIVGQWTDQEEVTFVVDINDEQFRPEGDALSEEQLRKKVEEAIGKGVGDFFTVPFVYDESTVFNRHKILEIEKNQQLGNQKDSVEYGDTIRTSYKRVKRMAGYATEREYLGGALLLVDDAEKQFAVSDVAYPEAVVADVIKKVQGKNRWSNAIRSYDEQYEYWFEIHTVNWYKEPSYELPKDWDYKFDAPKIGSFQEYSLEHAGTDDKEDGEYFGFPDWLSVGCSDWCGCSAYICEVEATSELANQGSLNYSASNLRAESRNSVWAEGVEGSGIGESIFVKQMYKGTGDVEFTISDICIVNGYAKNEAKWRENGRVKSLKLYYQDEYMGLITLEDTMNPQFIDVRPVQMKVGNGFDANFRFEIAEVYAGSKYEDTCLTGLLIDFEGKYAH